MKFITKLLSIFGIKTAEQKAVAAKKAATSAKRSQAQKDAWIRRKAKIKLPL